uniref:SGNH hydrolase-type esterase domain-containing protein n=1 Tax=Pygocentrus nattereri TaxID=42514 RepID=A0AAR2KVL1_PYGNA
GRDWEKKRGEQQQQRTPRFGGGARRTDALLRERLSTGQLSKPDHIIIHTGTNDLRAQQERVAESIRRVAQTATQTFPTAKVSISTILPRRDFHPATIQKINSEISRRCALLANVHLVHHPNLSIHNLHDHLYNIRRPYRWAQNSTEEFQKAIG